MLEKLYLKDMYLKEFNARITKVDGNKVTLDRTAFYPTGGGQPNDTGRITANGKEYNVTDVKKDSADVVHTLENAEGLKVGDDVKGVIDWEKRYAYMKYHTSIHIFDGIVITQHSNSGLSTGSQIYADRARIDFDMPDLTRELAQEILDQTNKVIEEGRRIIVKEVGRDEALQMPNLVRTEPGRELIKRLDNVRIVEIEGLDMQMDGGLHVLNSNEIGRLALSSFTNKGSHSKRVELEIEK
jgi:misacylated tRNA(Ala) deacylase